MFPQLQASPCLWRALCRGSPIAPQADGPRASDPRLHLRPGQVTHHHRIRSMARAKILQSHLPWFHAHRLQLRCSHRKLHAVHSIHLLGGGDRLPRDHHSSSRAPSSHHAQLMTTSTLVIPAKLHPRLHHVKAALQERRRKKTALWRDLRL